MDKLKPLLEFECPKYYDFTKINDDSWNETDEETILR
jgi:hypothetical protein